MLYLLQIDEDSEISFIENLLSILFGSSLINDLFGKKRNNLAKASSLQ